MKYPLAAAVLFAAAAPVIAVPAPAPGIGQMQQHLRGVSTMTARFSQTNQAGKTLTGTLTLKRPGRIRFQYQPGVQLLIVGDGKALTMVDYQVKQVSRWPIDDSPLSILLDPNKDVSAYAHVVPGAGPGRLVVEGRDPKHPEFGTITIGFAASPSAPGGLMLAGWTVVDAQGNRSVVSLSDQRFNAPVSDRMFLWNDPRPQTRGH